MSRTEIEPVARRARPSRRHGRAVNVVARTWRSRSSLGRKLRVLGGIAVLSSALSACGGPSAPSVTWHGPFTSTAFGDLAHVDALVAWRDHLWAAGYDKRGPAVWESGNGRAGVRHPSPGDEDTQLLATPGSLVMLCWHAFGTGAIDGPPPYEHVTSISTSRDGLHWNKEPIPAPLAQGAIGTAVWGHGRVVLPANNLYTRQFGVWTETARRGPWTFHPAFDKSDGALEPRLTTTPSGFAAGGWFRRTPSARQVPVVWTSSDGIRWNKHVLSTSTGAVDAVKAVGPRLVAVGSLGQSPGKGTAWTSSASRWRAAKVTTAFPPTVDQLLVTGVGIVGIPWEEAMPIYHSAEGTRWSALRRPARFRRASAYIVAAAPWKGGIAAIVGARRSHSGVRSWVARLGS